MLCESVLGDRTLDEVVEVLHDVRLFDQFIRLVYLSRELQESFNVHLCLLDKLHALLSLLFRDKRWLFCRRFYPRIVLLLLERLFCDISAFCGISRSVCRFEVEEVIEWLAEHQVSHDLIYILGLLVHLLRGYVNN